MIKKNILYIGGFELPDKNAAAHRVLSMSKSFKQYGNKIFFLGISKSIEEERIKKSSLKDKVGVEFYRKYPDNIKEWFNYLTSIKEIKKVISDNNIDVVIAYNYPSISLFKLLQYCRRNKIKLVADCTEWYVPKGSLLFRLIKGFDSNFRMKFVHPRLDGLIVISDYLFNYYKNKNSRIIKVPPTVDLAEEKWNVKSKLDETRTLIYAGTPGGKQKDHLGKVIQALKEIKEEYCLKIFGITKEEYDKVWFETPVDNLINEKKLQFLGRVTNKEVIENIKKAYFSIFIREDNLVTKAGFPTKFVEAISSGTPVLTNRCSNVEDFFEEYKNGIWLDIENKTTLKESLMKAFEISKEQLMEMKKYCKDSKKFDYNNFSKKLIDILQ